MAGIFNKAYDQADRMLNTSGISSLPVVYKDVGGRLLSGIDKLKDTIFDSNLPKDKKNELYNLLTGNELRSWQTGRAVPNTSWNKAASDFLKDIVVTATAPPGTPLGKGASMIPGLQTTTDLTRFGIRSLINNPTIRGILGNIDTYDYSKDIKEIQSKLKSNPDPDLAKELKDLIAIQKKEDLKRKNPLSAQYALYLDQFRPDKVVDGKRYYNPITDENKSKYFSEESQKKVGQELRENLESKLKAREEGTSSGQTLKTIGDADLISSEPDSLGKVYYGSYDSRGKWQEGIPNWDGTFTVKDEYNWNRDFPVGPGAIIRSLANYTNPNTRSLKSLAESIGGTVGPIGAQGEGRKIEFNVPAYSDPVKQLDVMRLLDRPPSVSPTGDLGGSPLYQPPQSDIVEEANKLGVPVIDVEQPGLPGMGWHHEAFDDPDDFTEQYADYHIGLKHGGQTMSRGLSGINKTININGQPHSLAWINPDEASALKAMGGSGKKVEGIPAYYYEDADEDFAPTYDQYQDFAADMGHSAASANVNYENFAESYPTSGQTYGTTITSDTPTHTSVPAAPDSYWGYEPEPDFGQTGPGLLGNKATENDAKSLWMTQYIQSNRPRHDPVSQEPIDIEKEYQKARNAPGGLQAIARGYQIGDPLGEQMRNSFNLVNQQLQNRFTERGMQKLEFTQDEITREELQDAAKDLVTDFTPYDGLDYPIWMPGGLAGQAINFFSRTVIGTGTVGGVGVHVHEDGTVTPISPEDSPGFDHESMRGENVPRRYRPRLEDKLSVSETITEKEPTGIAALQARRPEVASIGQSLQPQFDNIVAAGFSRQEAAEMLRQPVNIFA